MPVKSVISGIFPAFAIIYCKTIDADRGRKDEGSGKGQGYGVKSNHYQDRDSRLSHNRMEKTVEN